MGFVELKGQINQYTCEICKETITTINRDDGVTPMLIGCKINDDGLMESAWYRVDQTKTPNYEWYKPKKPKTDHEKQGGLVLREIEEVKAMDKEDASE